MKPIQRKAGILGTLLLAIAGFWLTLPAWMENQMRSALLAQGIAVESIGRIHAGLDGAEFVDVKLDRDGFNTIGSLYLQGLLFHPAIILRDVALQGDIGPDGRPRIEGWDVRPLTFPASIKSAILENATLDLDTSEGSIRIEAKGQMVPAEKGARHIDAVLRADQSQLSFETRWTIAWSPENWNAAAEIGTFRAKLHDLEMTRASGWLNLQSAAPGAPVLVTGQLAAGMMALGPEILRDISLTANTAPDGSISTILDARPAQRDGMRVYAELRQTNGPWMLNTRVTAKTMGDLSAFIGNMQAGMKSSPAARDALGGLLLTQGNLDRMEEDLKSFPYDSLTMTLTGPFYGLSGNITASNSASQERKTISFDPVKR